MGWGCALNTRTLTGTGDDHLVTWPDTQRIQCKLQSDGSVGAGERSELSLEKTPFLARPVGRLLDSYLAHRPPIYPLELGWPKDS